MKKIYQFWGIVLLTLLVISRSFGGNYDGVLQLSYLPAMGQKYTKEDWFPTDDHSQDLSFRHSFGVYYSQYIFGDFMMGWGIEYTHRGYNDLRKAEDIEDNILGEQEIKYLYTGLDFPLLFDYCPSDYGINPYITLGLSNFVLISYKKEYLHEFEGSTDYGYDYELKGFKELQNQYYRIYIPGIIIGAGFTINASENFMVAVQPYIKNSLRQSNDVIWQSKNKLRDIGCRISLMIGID